MAAVWHANRWQATEIYQYTGSFGAGLALEAFTGYEIAKHGISGILDISPEQHADEEESVMRTRRDRLLSNRLTRRFLSIAVVVLVLPYLLILVYAIPFTRPVSTLMLSELILFRGYDRRWVSLDDISPNLVRSVMMSEDGQFCFHGGVDWAQMRGVVEDALDGEATRGASTIPMQTVKNLFLWNGRSFIRKGLELPLAIGGDFVWSKRRIMEIYLNIAEWGPGIYGAEAAAQYHFKVPAAKLNARQAALLAVALPNPITRAAGKPGRGMQRLAAVVERRARSSADYIKCIYG
ncbi:monofunctional biosynthetic peptidoglycan transglycosylase [Neorhizobium sp. R1-B]|nr:monofunctional biosynthetic peptidoglycan transglycosylase [Neorhizobium sp. S3-V5DH]TDX80447.1 monofunctional biosynthetic peptidoglycan transglycosylase [Neorhizobium sp. R1-B]